MWQGNIPSDSVVEILSSYLHFMATKIDRRTDEHCTLRSLKLAVKQTFLSAQRRDVLPNIELVQSNSKKAIARGVRAQRSTKRTRGLQLPPELFMYVCEQVPNRFYPQNDPVAFITGVLQYVLKTLATHLQGEIMAVSVEDLDPATDVLGLPRLHLIIP